MCNLLGINEDYYIEDTLREYEAVERTLIISRIDDTYIAIPNKKIIDYTFKTDTIFMTEEPLRLKYEVKCTSCSTNVGTVESLFDTVMHYMNASRETLEGLDNGSLLVTLKPIEHSDYE